MTLYHYPLSENGIENPFFFTKYFSLIFPSTNTRITNDSREDEMEQNMQGVGNILGNLKNMATDMGDEIERQNKHLDLIQGKVTSYRANIYGFYFKNYYYQILQFKRVFKLFAVVMVKCCIPSDSRGGY